MRRALRVEGVLLVGLVLPLASGCDALLGSLQDRAADASVDGSVNHAEGGTGPDASMSVENDGGGADAEEEASVCVSGALCNPAPCLTGLLSCDGGAMCTAMGTATDGVACDAGAVCSHGSCSACVVGADCSEAGSCQLATISCSSGAPVCTAGGNSLNGSTCGPSLYCSSGLCAACTTGGSCAPPANPCHLGTSSCSDGGLTCTDQGTNAPNGTPCGAGMVCASGTCTACTSGASCNPSGNLCQTGTTSCTTGASTCANATDVQNGTACGTNMVCSSGQCTACTANAACSPNSNVCLLGYVDCSSGSAVCTQNGLASAGTPCGASQVCDGNGNCGACTTGTSCNPSGNVCMTGTTSCTTGTSTCANATAVQSGTACGTNMVCNSGACTACTANQVCNPTACTVGTTSCASGTSACVDVTDVNTGASCGTNMVCSNGQCVACTAGTSCTPSNPCQTGATSCATGASTCASSGNVTDLTACTGSAGSGVCCSGSCEACSTPANASPACSSTGSCTYTCISGYSACNGVCSNFQTDAANCGTCGHSCNGGACSGGACQPFVVAQPPTTSTVLDLATDGTHLLWTDSGLGGAYEITLSTGTVVNLGSISGVKGIAVAGSYVGVTGLDGSYPDQYWGFNNESGLTSSYTGGLERDSGGSMTPFLAVESNAQNLCWIDVFSSMTYIECCPFIDGSGGCGVTQSMSGNPYGAQIGAGASGFYWSDVSTGTVYTVAYGGTSSAVVTFATSQSSANMVTADSSYAYWTTNGTSILRAPSTGSPGTVHTVGSATSTITSMASDGNYVHFTYAGAVGHLSTSALTQTTTSATGSPMGVVASSGLVFWFVASTNTIYGMTYP